MNGLVLKAVGAIALAPLSLDPIRRPLERHLASRSSFTWTALFLGSRLAISGIAFGVLQLRLPSDAAHYYANFGRAVLQSGHAAGSPYSPVFDYLMAALLWTFHTPVSFIAMLTIAEAAAFGLTASAVRAVDPSLGLSIAALWLVSPLSIFNVALGGQDEALIVLAFAAVIWAVLHRREVTAGALVGAGVIVSKILALFALLPVLCLCWRRAARGTTAAVGVLATAVAILSLTGLPLLGFLREAQRMTSGNIWAVASLVAGSRGPAGLALQAWAPLMIATTVAAVAVAVLLMRHAPADALVEQILRVVGTVGCVFLIFSVKAFPSYLMMFLPGVLFLMLKVPPAVRVGVVLVFVPLSVVESSTWFLLEPWGDLLPIRSGPRLVLAVVDSLLVAGYGVLAWRGLTLVRATRVGRAEPIAIAG